MTDTTGQQQLSTQERLPMLQASLVTSVMAVLAVLPMSSAFYDVLRIAIVTWAVLTVVHTFRSAPPRANLLSLRVWPFLVAAVAAGVLWFPYRFTFDKPVWVVLDLVFAAVAAIVGWRLERTHPWKKPRWPARGVTALTLSITVLAVYFGAVHGHAEQLQEQERCAQLSDRQQRANMECTYDPLNWVDDEDIPGSDHYPG